jgi:hypothetical protein
VGLFDLFTGVARWSLRLGAYVALLTDVYPPFRLDQVPQSPGTNIRSAQCWGCVHDVANSLRELALRAVASRSQHRAEDLAAGRRRPGPRRCGRTISTRQCCLHGLLRSTGTIQMLSLRNEIAVISSQCWEAKR